MSEVQVLGPVQTAFVEALESGDYIQDKNGGMMKSVNEESGVTEYCCLGVAREIASQLVGTCDFRNKWVFSDYEKLGMYSPEGNVFRHDENEGALFRYVEKEGVKFNNLMNMNDGVKKSPDTLVRFTFPEIAAEIRKNPANFFGISV